MRIGVYGGTFDPVHYGHLLAAEQCREQCALDEVCFVPARRPPHKPDADISDAALRVEMLELATAGDPRLTVSRIEIEADGPRYTVETLERLQRESSDRELFFIAGADSLSDFPTWREPQRILELATLLVVNRGRTPPDLAAAVAALGTTAAARIQVVTMPAIDLSASDIRQRLRDGRSIRYMTPRSVEEYARSRYR